MIPSIRQIILDRAVRCEAHSTAAALGCSIRHVLIRWFCDPDFVTHSHIDPAVINIRRRFNMFWGLPLA